MSAGRPQPERARARRYRLVCYEQLGDAQRLIFDAAGEGFVAATGTITEDGTMTGELASAGPPTTQQHLALLIANDPEIAGRSAERSSSGDTR